MAVGKRTAPLRTAEQGRRRMSKIAWREAIHGYLFILPWVLGFFLFTFGPMLMGLYYSFTEYTILAPPKWIGLQNYKEMLGDPLVAQSLYNTLYYVVFAVPLTLIAGLLFAILLNQDVKGIPLFRTLFYIPAIVPAVASVALWIWIFNGRWGLLNQFLRSWGIPGPGWLTDPSWTKPSLIIWTVWGMGTTMIIFLAGLQGIPDVFHEAAKIDGAGTMRRFWHITMPLLTPTIFFNLILRIIESFQIFTAVLILGGTQTLSYQTPAGGPLNSLLVYVLYIYQNAFYFFKMGYGAAMAWLLFAIVFVLTVVQFRVARRWVYYEADGQ